MNTDAPIEPTSRNHPRRRFYIGGAVLVGIVMLAGLALFLGRSDNSSGGQAETKNAALSSGLQSLVDMARGSGSQKATLTNVSLGAGISVDSMTVSRTSSGTVTGTATVTLGGSGLKLGMDASFSDENNWSLNANASNTTTFSPTTGISVDPSTITGSIVRTNGSTTWSLVGSTVTWNISRGAVLTTTFSVSNTCPFTDTQKCPSATSSTVYLGMPSASLKIDGVSNTILLAGGLDISGAWSRLEGTAGNVTFEGTGISNTQAVVWKGERLDSYDPSMTMPDLSSLNNGVNVEFCGTFSISIPQVTNKSTNGCTRWSQQGIVIAQSGGSTTVVTSMPTTDASGATVAASASANVKGFAWTNIPSSTNLEIAFGGVKTALESRKWNLAGMASLPGVAANALGIDLKGATSLNFEVRGTFSATEISMSGDIPVNLTIGSEPFKINAKSLRATLAAGTSTGFSFSIGTTSNVTLGYAPNTRDITSSLSLVAATKPSVGMVLSLSAVGQKNTVDANVTGTTIASRLSRPDLASFIWPDQFGIRGLNLFSLTGNIGWMGGSPVVSYTSSSYLNPQGADMGKIIQCNGSCDPSDWMISSLAISASYTNPCFAYGFDGTAGGSTLAVDGGVMKTSVFKIGVAPTGCSIQSGDQTLSLPVGFFGFQFSAQFGSATFDVATQLTAEGFVFQSTATNFTLAGISYPNITLNVKIDSSGSNVSFSGTMQSVLGTSNVSANLSGSSSGISQELSASVTNWSLGRAGTLTVPKFAFTTSFTIPFDGGCAEMSASATGEMLVKSKTYRLKIATFTLDCRGLKGMTLSIDMQHVMAGGGTLTSEFRLVYVNSKYGGGKSLMGAAGFEYVRNKSWELADKTFERDIKISISAGFRLLLSDPGNADFQFSGSFSADRVSGSLGCMWATNGMDFRCNGELRLNPRWAGIYNKTWGDL
jgi:hypothetical protein